MDTQRFNILAIIPARGGSKQLPNKNIYPLVDKPLIYWTIKTAQHTADINKIVVSTDAAPIADVAEKYGAEVPFLRPFELAQDDTSDLPVYQHAVTWLEMHQTYRPDIIVWLRPTSPLRNTQDITQAIRLLIETKADWVRSVYEVEQHPFWATKLEGNILKPFIDGIDIKKYYRRQLLPLAYYFNGAVEVAWYETIMQKKLLYSGDVRGYVMPAERSIDIDSEIDIIHASYYLQKNAQQ